MLVFYLLVYIFFLFQALDWLLHTVTQAACLHDLLWWFVFALTPSPNPQELDPEQLKEEHEIKREDHVNNFNLFSYTNTNVCLYNIKSVLIFGLLYSSLL